MTRSLLQPVKRDRRAPHVLCGAFLLLALALCLAGCALPDLLGREDPTGEGDDARGPADGEAAGERDYAAGQAEAYTQPEAPLIRVGLAHGVRNAAVTGRGAYTVSVYADTMESWVARPGAKWRFGAAGGGISGSGSGKGFHIDAGTVRISPSGEGLLVFDDVAYRGEIEFFAPGPGSLTVVNIVDVESYLRGVVPREIGPRPEREIEAVKAQAVAARTYAVASGGRRAGGGFDVFATVDDQVYAGADGEDPVCDRAILETAGVFISRDGEPIHAYFHANCGGRTEARHEVWELPSVPYLTSVWDTPGADRFNDAYCSSGTHFTWTETWTGSEISGLVREQLPAAASTPVRGPVGDLVDIRVSARTPSGRSRWLEVETSGGTYRVFGDRVRWLLRRPGTGKILRSSWFELDVRTRGGKVDEVTARGRGYGHGVGMCQHGALEMARRGHSYEEILRHYYAGIELTRMGGSALDATEDGR